MGVNNIFLLTSESLDLEFRTNGTNLLGRIKQTVTALNLLHHLLTKICKPQNIWN